MILDALTVAELKLLARARGIDLKGFSGRDALVYRIEQEFFRDPHLLPHLLQDLTPPARAILDYMGVMETEVTVHEICAFLRLRGFIKTSRPTLIQETYWELIKQELILKGLVIITQKLEEYPVAKRDEWCWYRLAIPPQFLPQIPLPELPAIELSPAGLSPFSCLDFARVLLLSLLWGRSVPVPSRPPEGSPPPPAQVAQGGKRGKGQAGRQHAPDPVAFRGLLERMARLRSQGDSPSPPAEASPDPGGGEDLVGLPEGIDPAALHALVEKMAGRLLYGEQGIARREGNVPQLDCWKAVLPLLAQEIAGHKFGRMILHQLKRLKQGQWCEAKTLEAVVAEYGLLEKPPPEVEGYLASVFLPSGFGQKALHEGRPYYRLAPEIFSYLTEGLLPEFPQDEADSFEPRGEAIAFRCSRANPATLWRMSFIGRGALEGEWLIFTLDRIRLARLQQAGIDPAPLFEALKEILPPAFLQQYAAFRTELGKNTLYFHYTPIQIQDETLALFLQHQLPELIPLGDQFYLLASEKVERLQALLKKNNYVARVVACSEGGAR